MLVAITTYKHARENAWKAWFYDMLFNRLMTGHCPSKIHEKENDLLENVWFQRTFNSLTPTKTSTQV